MSCGRQDDARLWAFLRRLIEEFSLSTSDQHKPVFSETTTSTARIPTSPPLVSPRGSFQLVESKTSFSPVATKRPHSPLTSGPSPIIQSTIPLHREENDTSVTQTDHIESLVESPAVSRSSSSARGRFRASAPASTRTSSADTAASTRKSPLVQVTQTRLHDHTIEEGSSSDSDDGAMSPRRMAKSPPPPPVPRRSSSSREGLYMVTSRTSRSSVGSTGPDKVVEKGKPLSRTGSLQSQTKGKVVSESGPPSVLSEPAGTSAEARLPLDYRRKRERVLLEWWRTYVDDVSP